MAAAHASDDATPPASASPAAPQETPVAPAAMDQPPAPGGHAVPTPLTDRIEALDVLRGFAVLGILLMNVQSFGLPFAQYTNPFVQGELRGFDFLTWATVHVVADQKFMTLFSLLFGASLLLFMGRAEPRGRGFGLWARRSGVLLLIGLAHAYLIWFGDILVAYALCGLVVYFLRKRSVRTQVIVGLLLFSVTSLLYLFFGHAIPHMPPEAVADMRADWSPPAAELAAETAAFQGGWLAQMGARAEAAFYMQTFVFLIFTFWRVTGLMLLGMALYRLRVLTGERSPLLYAWMAAAGIAVGGALIIIGVTRNSAAGFNLEYSMFLGIQWNYWGSLALALGYAGAVLWICRRGWLTPVRKALAAVGRIALTAYLLQSVLAFFIFYGTGLGLHSQLSYPQLLAVVLLIWAAVLAFALTWTRLHRYGPMEWLWRKATYGG